MPPMIVCIYGCLVMIGVYGTVKIVLSLHDEGSTTGWERFVFVMEWHQDPQRQPSMVCVYMA